jgi:hypothetical protein
MKEIKTKVIWAAVVVPADKEIIAIEPLRVICKNGWFDKETITIEGHLMKPDEFIKKAAELIIDSSSLLNEKR